MNYQAQARLSQVQIQRSIENVVQTGFGPDYDRALQWMQSMPMAQRILFVCGKSPSQMFVACQLLSKTLKSSSEYTLLQSMTVGNYQTMKNIVKFLFSYVLQNERVIQKHVINSCLNSMSLLLRFSTQIYLEFTFAFYDFMKILPVHHPHYTNAYLIDQIISFNPLNITLAKQHRFALTLMSFMIDNVISLSNHTYFKYAVWSINIMQSKVLPYLFAYVTNYIKLSINGHSFGSEGWLQAIKLLQLLMTYPFDIDQIQSHEFQNYLEDIYQLEFDLQPPRFFRNYMQAQTNFFQVLLQSYVYRYGNNHVQENKSQVYSLTRIFCRWICFGLSHISRHEKRQKMPSIQKRYLEHYQDLLKVARLQNPYLIDCLLRTAIKIAQECCFDKSPQNILFLQNLIEFLGRCVNVCKVRIQDGSKNVISRIFEITKKIECSYFLEMQYIKFKSTDLLECFYRKILNNHQIQESWTEFGQENPEEVECFTDMLEYGYQMFRINEQINIDRLKQLNCQELPMGSIKFWLYYSIETVLNLKDSIDKAILTSKFVGLAQKHKSVASIHFLSKFLHLTLRKQCFQKNRFLQILQEHMQFSLDGFLLNTLNLVGRNFILSTNQPNQQLVKATLGLFETVYSKIKHFKDCSKYFDIVKQLLDNINETVFSLPPFFNNRRVLFRIATSLWGNEQKLQNLTQIYKVIYNNLNQNNVQKYHLIQRYLLDLIGILQGIKKKKNQKMIVELSCNDFQGKLKKLFQNQKHFHSYLKMDNSRQIFCDFLLEIMSFTQASFHNLIVLQLQEILFFTVDLFMKSLSEDDQKEMIEKSVKILRSFIKLNPLGRLPYLSEVFLKKRVRDFNRLVDEYFQSIHRLKETSEFQHIYKFIIYNQSHFITFWDQVIDRGVRPSIQLLKKHHCRAYNPTHQNNILKNVLSNIRQYSQQYFCLYVKGDKENIIQQLQNLQLAMHE